MKPMLVLLGIFLSFFFLYSLHFFSMLTRPLPMQPKKEIATSVPSLVLPFPTLESVFQEDHQWIATLPAEKTQTIIATGDVIPARSVNTKVVAKNDPLWPYAKVAPFFKTQKHDLIFINLETPLLQNCPSTIEGMVFCGDKKNIEGLTHIGVDIANVANNHFGNYGKRGIDETLTLLTDHNITPTGTDEAVLKTIRGTTFAFLGFNDIDHKEEGIAWADKENVIGQIRNAKKNSDIVVVTFHFGTEYQNQPDKRQIELAHLAVDNGADVVIGNHPHWIQPIELYKGKFITYAHGNFIFDQMWSQKTREGVVGKYTFYDKKLIDVEFFPIQIEDFGQPFFLERTQKKRILAEMKKESQHRAGFVNKN